jgi:phage baseplate assembly protein W
MANDKRHQDNMVRMAAEIGAKTAIEAYERRIKIAQAERTDRRLRNTKLLLRNYRLFKEHCENAVYEVEQLDESVYDILETLEGADNSLFVESIKKSVARTVTIVQHIDVMLQLYDTYCYRSKSPEEERRYRVIKALYVDENPPDIDGLAKQENINKRTIYKDVDAACERLSALIFGIDGIKKS